MESPIFNWLKQWLSQQPLKKAEKPAAKQHLVTARIVPQGEHPIVQNQISQNTIKVLRRLHEAGYDAYLVGGGVRDLLLNRVPKDFDIATNALPEDVYKLFRNCRLIGKRFRLAHVYFGREIIEVATFRAIAEQGHPEAGRSKAGMIIRDNVYGTIEEDALRRDFTVNALYYNYADGSVVDFATGIEDLNQGVIRFIGDPWQRYHEDPVRMLRAVRLSAKLGFHIEPATEKPIYELAGLLQNVSSARLYQEVLKLFLEGYAAKVYRLLRTHGLFAMLFPQTEAQLGGGKTDVVHQFLEQLLANTDHRILQGKTVNPAFLLAGMLWYPMRTWVQKNRKAGHGTYAATQLAAEKVLQLQVRRLAMPRRITSMVKEIWTLQYQLNKSRNRRAFRVFNHPRFRAGYDFLLLRTEAGEPVVDRAEWWTEFLSLDEAGREQFLAKQEKQK